MSQWLLLPDNRGLRFKSNHYNFIITDFSQRLVRTKLRYTESRPTAWRKIGNLSSLLLDNALG